MQSDRILIAHQKQPLHQLSWTRAAKDFLTTSTDFLKPKGKMFAGQWSPICFPFFGIINRSVSDLTDSDFNKMKKIIEEFRQCNNQNYADKVDELEKLFQSYLEYPPYPLHDDWDGKSDVRRCWAEEVFKGEPKLRFA